MDIITFATQADGLDGFSESRIHDAGKFYFALSHIKANGKSKRSVKRDQATDKPRHVRLFSPAADGATWWTVDRYRKSIPSNELITPTTATGGQSEKKVILRIIDAIYKCGLLRIRRILMT